jgi:hypothetical protein
VTMLKLRIVSVLCSVLVLSSQAVADPGFATPPDAFPGEAEEIPHDEAHYGIAVPPSSTVRASVGPALLLSSRSTEGGFAAMFDIGARAAGARITGAWLNVGGDNGLSQYTGELWVDFGIGRQLHPILAAGAGLARIEHAADDGGATRSTVGVGTLRGSLEYMLPIAEADARAGLDVTGAVPAIRASDSNAPGEPWVMAVARVGVGF